MSNNYENQIQMYNSNKLKEYENQKESKSKKSIKSVRKYTQISPIRGVGPETTRCTYTRVSAIQYKRFIHGNPNSEGNRFILNKDL